MNVFSYVFYTAGIVWGQIDPGATKCVQDTKNLLSWSFYVYLVVPIILEKIIKAKNVNI